jgi:hypothetical protein
MIIMRSLIARSMIIIFVYSTCSTNCLQNLMFLLAARTITMTKNTITMTNWRCHKGGCIIIRRLSYQKVSLISLCTLRAVLFSEPPLKNLFFSRCAASRRDPDAAIHWPNFKPHEFTGHTNSGGPGLKV